MRHSPAPSTRRRGAVALVALFVLIPLGALTLAFLHLGTSFNREQDARIGDEAALFLAEAGLAEGLFALRMGGSGDVASAALPARCGDGVFWVEADPVGNDLLRLRSSAMRMGGRVALEALVFHFTAPPYSSAIFSNQSFQLTSNVFIDSFDSALGSYGDQLAALGGSYVAEGATVISNGDIAVDPATVVHGDVHAGPQGSLSLAGSSTVSGTTEGLGLPRELPPVSVPPILQTGNYAAPSGTPRVILPGDYGFGFLTVQTAGDLTVQGPARLVVGDWTLRSNSRISFDTSGGPIELYISGTVDMASNSIISTMDDSALDLSLFLVGGPTQSAVFKSNSQFYGTIYAPEGTVEIRSNFEVYGAVAADQVVLSSNARIHYDEQLTGLAPGPPTFQMSTWSGTGFPVAAWSRDRRDPFQLLGLAPSDLPLPGDAHDAGAP